MRISNVFVQATDEVAQFQRIENIALRLSWHFTRALSLQRLAIIESPVIISGGLFLTTELRAFFEKKRSVEDLHKFHRYIEENVKKFRTNSARADYVHALEM